MAAARWLSPIFFVALSVCSTPRVGPGLRPDPQLITEDEVVASLATTAYELIRNLRPNFLTYRGETSFDRRTSRPYPNVYVDDQAFAELLTALTGLQRCRLVLPVDQHGDQGLLGTEADRPFRNRLTTRRVDQRDSLGRARFGAVADCDTSALLAHGDRGRTSDARGTAGDQCRLTVENASHLGFSLVLD